MTLIFYLFLYWNEKTCLAKDWRLPLIREPLPMSTFEIKSAFLSVLLPGSKKKKSLPHSWRCLPQLCPSCSTSLPFHHPIPAPLPPPPLPVFLAFFTGDSTTGQRTRHTGLALTASLLLRAGHGNGLGQEPPADVARHRHGDQWRSPYMVRSGQSGEGKSGESVLKMYITLHSSQ